MPVYKTPDYKKGDEVELPAYSTTGVIIDISYTSSQWVYEVDIDADHNKFVRGCDLQ